MYELQSSPSKTPTGKRPTASSPSIRSVSSRIYKPVVSPNSMSNHVKIVNTVMNFYIIALAMMASMASATVVVVGTTSTVALSGAAVLLGAKLLAAKGLLLGAALKRGRRETISEVFLDASKKDQYDCAKMLICELNSRPVQTLEVRKTFILEAANLQNGNSLQKINISV